jgi:hypothetical protein
VSRTNQTLLFHCLPHNGDDIRCLDQPPRKHQVMAILPGVESVRVRKDRGETVSRSSAVASSVISVARSHSGVNSFMSRTSSFERISSSCRFAAVN